MNDEQVEEEQHAHRGASASAREFENQITGIWSISVLRDAGTRQDSFFYGPSFGGGHDIYVADNANNNITSYTNVSTYQLPEGQNAQTFLTGARNFQAAEIEVFGVTSITLQGERVTENSLWYKSGGSTYGTFNLLL